MGLNESQWRVANLQRKTAEKLRALTELDTQCYFTQRVLGADDDTALRTLHRLRYEEPAMPTNLRADSEAWMKAHGVKRLANREWPDDGSQNAEA